MKRTPVAAAIAFASFAFAGCLGGAGPTPNAIDGSLEFRAGEGVDLAGRFIMQVLGPSYASDPSAIELSGPGAIAAAGLSCAKDYRVEAWDHDPARAEKKGTRLHGSAPLDCTKDGEVLATITIRKT